jgi:hypothetical protein
MIEHVLDILAIAGLLQTIYFLFTKKGFPQFSPLQYIFLTKQKLQYMYFFSMKVVQATREVSIPPAVKREYSAL